MPQPPTARLAVLVRILLIRGEAVMLDRDLAALYGVSTRELHDQVHRHRGRFPAGCLLRLTAEEAATETSQSATLDGPPAGRRATPLGFTERGIAQLARVLRRAPASEMHSAIRHAFRRLRRLRAGGTDLARRLARQERQGKRAAVVFVVLRRLVARAEVPWLRIRR